MQNYLDTSQVQLVEAVNYASLPQPQLEKENFHLWTENDLAKDSDEIRTTVRKKLNMIIREMELNVDLIREGCAM